MPGLTAAAVTSGWAAFAVQESLVSEEIVHDLDTCEVTVEGEELNPDQESLEVDVARLQQKGIEVSHSNLGVVFTGEGLGGASRREGVPRGVHSALPRPWPCPGSWLKLPAGFSLSPCRCGRHGQLRGGPAPPALSELAHQVLA